MGFQLDGAATPPDGSPVLFDGQPVGWATSVRYSWHKGKVIGMGWVTPAQAKGGSRITLRCDAIDYPASVVRKCFTTPTANGYTSERTAIRLAPLSPRRRRPPEDILGWQMPAWYDHAPPRELEEVRGSVGVSDASYLTKLDLRGRPNELSLRLHGLGAHAKPCPDDLAGNHRSSFPQPR